ncbi:MAG TPA: O-antigen ligase family protein [Blastocatellia bacterium]|nr:O-antigen ligase family protein [Blastocatellia bacterium]
MQSAIRINRADYQEGKRSPHSAAFAGLFFFTLLLYARPNDTFPELLGTFPFVKIVAIITLLAYFASKISLAEPLTIWPIELKMLAIITLLGVAFIPIAASPKDSIDLLADTFLKVATIFVLMINLLDSRERLRSIIKLAVICGTVLAVLAILTYMQGKFTVVTRGEDYGVAAERITGAVGGIFGNPNDLATSFDLLIPLAAALAFMRRGLARAAYFTCALLLSIGVVVTFSRGGFLGLVASVGWVVWKMGRRNRALTVIAFVFLLGIFMVVMPSGYSSRITSIFDSSSDPTGSSQARIDLLERASDIASNHLIFGVGIGNYTIYSLHEQRAHNSFLEISAELGVTGLLAYLIMIFAPLRSLRRIGRETVASRESGAGQDQNALETYYLSAAFQASLLAYIVCSCFGSIQYLWFLYYPLAYAVSLRRIHEAEALAAEESAPAMKVVQARPRAVLWKPHQRRKQAPALAAMAEDSEAHTTNS